MTQPWAPFSSGPSGLNILVVPDAEAALEATFAELVQALARNREPRIGLATGGTFRPFFQRMVEAENEGRLDLRHAEFTHLDEYEGLGHGDYGSMHSELAQLFIDQLQHGVSAFHPVPASAADPVGSHKALLESVAPLDLQFLGIGRNGHIAFNEPGASWAETTHLVELTKSTQEANAGRFGGSNGPDRALTMGVAGIMAARRLVLVATGTSKASAVMEMLESAIGPHCPASMIRLHQEAIVILDRAAAAQLGPRAWRRPKRLPTQVLLEDQLQPSGPVAVVSPHPDDASISCGGLLSALGNRVPLHIVTATTGARSPVPGNMGRDGVIALREAEVRREAEILGAHAHFLRSKYYDSRIFEAEDSDRMLALFQSIKPAWIIGPATTDPHPTHAMTRLVMDDAIDRYVALTNQPIEVWTFEGAWHQHLPSEVNALVVYTAQQEATKLAAVRSHASQLARVPFDTGALALSKLRAVTFSELHFGGDKVDTLKELPCVEAYLRDVIEPS